ncbi:hypothetical protein [Streptomyces sp. CRN 30]|uniref:hypothetical protein n=1 Tax=Streptomyces sp. CRN 30 TaxID=3075613 RepID=UPI002A7FEA8D|nr:hypothetical protein [Streptomyces sp. CRN 30]
MSGANENTSRKTESTRTAASKARQATDKATAPASRSAKTAAAKAEGATSAAKSATTSAAERSAEVTSGAAQAAAKGVETGRQAIVTASGQVAATAKTAWTVLKHRKLIAAGVGAGVTVLTAASYAVGRRAERHSYGPVTRWTGGRI